MYSTNYTELYKCLSFHLRFPFITDKADRKAQFLCSKHFNQYFKQNFITLLHLQTVKSNIKNKNDIKKNVLVTLLFSSFNVRIAIEVSLDKLKIYTYSKNVLFLSRTNVRVKENSIHLHLCQY